MSLFSTITYHISPSLPPTLVGQLDLVLKANGGTRAEGTKDPKLNLVITDSLRFEGWEDVAARRAATSTSTSTSAEGTHTEEGGKQKIDVVTPNFVERSLIIGQLQSPQHYSADPSLFFSGVIACGADLPPSDLEVLSGGITGLGGQWRSALTSECTHLFAISPDSPKYHTAMHFKEDTGIKIVLPHWFDDCVRLGIRGLEEDMYEWPECRILKGPEGLLPAKEREREREREKEKAKTASQGKVLAKGGVLEKDVDIERERERMKHNLFITAARFTPSMNRSSPPSDADLTLVAPPPPSVLGLGLGRAAASSNLTSAINAQKTNGTGKSPNTNTSLLASALAPEPHAVWEGRKILLSRTLQLYGHRREAVQAGIERAGGQVLRFEGDHETQEEDASTSAGAGGKEGSGQAQVQGWNEKIGRKERRRRRREAERVGDCDVYVTRWRFGRAYVQAVREHKMIGTLAWLFHVQSCGVLTHPINQLLHYPVPKRPIEAFEKHVITVTNYTGEAREYLKKLVSAMGAEFTPSMSGGNTVLVAAYTSGTKAQKALAWSIPVVNHLWLEDCFIAWRNLTVANEKYIIFRPGDDFSKQLGERGLSVGVANGISGAYGCARRPDGVGKEGEVAVDEAAEGDRELGRIEQEAEELAEDMDEAGVDDLGNSDDDAVEEAEEERRRLEAIELENRKERERGLQMQMPNGTEASMKEVMDDLVPDQGGGGVDFGMAVDVDGDVGMEFDDDEVAGRMASTPKNKVGGGPGKAKVVKPTFNPAHSASKSRVAEEKKGKSKAKPKKVSDDESMEEEEEEEEEEEDRPKKSSKSSKPTKATPVVMLSKTKPTAKSNGKSKTSDEDKEEDEDDDQEEDEEEDPTPPPQKVKSSAKSQSKRRQRLPTSSEEEVADGDEEDRGQEADEEEMDVDPQPKSKPSKQAKEKEKKQATRNANVSSKAKSKANARAPPLAEEEEESTPAPAVTTKGKTKMKPKQASSSKASGHAVGVEDDDDETEIIPAKAKAKAKPKAPEVRQERPVGGLLGKVKGDARTRIKRKSDQSKAKPLVVEVESEDDEEDEEEQEVPVKKSVRKAKAKEVKGRKTKADDEDDEEDEVEVLVTGSKTKTKSSSKTNGKKKTVAESSDEEEEVDPPPKKRPRNPPSPAVRPRTKPLRVYSTAEEDVDQDDDEDEDEIPPAASDGSDTDLPENPILSTKPHKLAGKDKAREKANNAAASSSKSKPTKKDLDAKGKGKKTAPPATDTEDEDEQPAKPTTPRKSKTTTSTSAPLKRVVSVLMPSLKLSPSKASIGKDTERNAEASGSKTLSKGKAAGKKKAASSSSSDEDEQDEVPNTKKKPATTSKSKPPAKPQPKAPAKASTKAKPPPPPVASVESETESEAEEKEVSVLISPRAARALGRTESVRAVAGQTSVSPVKGAGAASVSSGVAAAKTKNANHNAIASSSKAKSTATTKSKANSKPKPADNAMDVDNDNASTSTAPISARPSRSAATKATQRLHETIMPDLLQYEMQKKKSKRLSNGNSAAFALAEEERVSESQISAGGGKRRKADDDGDGEDGEEEDGKAKKKRRVSSVVVPADDEEDEEGEEAPKPTTKTGAASAKAKGKAKATVDDAMDVDEEVSPASGIKIVTTQVTLSEEVIKALGKLGAKITTRPAECTHLLAPHVVRTEKFLCALASRAPWILQEKWATESAKAKRILPEKDFILKDKQGESKYGVNLANSLKRAKELKDKGGLLKGHTFYLTPKVPVETKLLKNVVVACGGLISTQTPTQRIINAAPTTRHIISSKEDIAIWRPIVSSSRGTRIYTQELLLTGILNQQIEWEKEEYFVEGSY